jgi:hypothetical protein
MQLRTWAKDSEQGTRASLRSAPQLHQTALWARRHSVPIRTASTGSRVDRESLGNLEWKWDFVTEREIPWLPEEQARREWQRRSYPTATRDTPSQD